MNLAKTESIGKLTEQFANKASVENVQNSGSDDTPGGPGVSKGF